MIIIFAFIACTFIIGMQIFQLLRFMRVVKNEAEAGNELRYKEASWFWYGSQTFFTITSIVMSFSSDSDAYSQAVFIVLSGFFFANIVLGITFKRVYYNDNGFIYQQRFVPYPEFVSCEPSGKSKRTYQINTKNEVLFMEKKRALFLWDRYQEYQNSHK